jgi:hypothetical protein
MKQQIKKPRMLTKSKIESLRIDLKESYKAFSCYEQMTENQKWLRRQGGCCIDGCNGEPEHIDNLDNVFCSECCEQDMRESPENWDDS